jgi:ribosome-binding factor A
MECINEYLTTSSFVLRDLESAGVHLDVEVRSVRMSRDMSHAWVNFMVKNPEQVLGM